MKLLALVTDAFGGRGGIAKFNRDLLTTLSEHQACERIVALPRIIVETPSHLPRKLDYRAESAGGKIRYLRHVFRAITTERFDGVICGHLNLLPVAAAVSALHRVPLLLVVHGVEVWRYAPSRLLRHASRRVDVLVSVSDFTRQRFLQWTSNRNLRSSVIPNCVDAQLFGSGPKPAELLSRYALRERTVLLTVARLSASERYKGVDEVLELLPELGRRIPTLSYLLVGDGDDRARLAAKAAALGVSERVVFAGYIPESEKAAHYRIADAFVMAGRGEGFGIVYLEALASGVPVVASTADASREAVLNGTMGELADPDKPHELEAAILRALERPVGIIPKALENFSVEKFRERWSRLVDEVFCSESASDKSSNCEFTKDATVRPLADPPQRRVARTSLRSRN